MNKRICHLLLIILIVAIVSGALYFYVPKTSGLSILNSGNELDTTILKTSINQISETGETITYRLRWTSVSTDSTCDARKSFNLNFIVGDIRGLNKPNFPDDVPNQFGVEGEVALTGLKAYSNPCEPNQKIVSIDNLIQKQSAECLLINFEGKPGISCEVNVGFKSQVPVNYYGNIDGYADITFRKVSK